MLTGCHKNSVKLIKLGLLYGMSEKKLLKIKKHYDILVVNPKNVKEKDLSYLKKHATKIYGYIDIACLSTSSKDLKSFKNLTLGKTVSGKKYYMDVTSSKWQNYIKKEIKNDQALSLNGYMIDHLDVYSHYKTSKNYSALKTMVTSLQNAKPVIFSNAKDFILKDTKILKNVTAITQEDVFTYWDHKKDARENVSKKVSDSYKAYLKKMVSLKQHVIVIDFTKKSDWHAVINAYTKKYGMQAYYGKKTNYTKE
jgi:hypothetical protein